MTRDSLWWLLKKEIKVFQCNGISLTTNFEEEKDIEDGCKLKKHEAFPSMPTAGTRLQGENCILLFLVAISNTESSSDITIHSHI